MTGESRLDARLRSTLEQRAVDVREIDTPSGLREVVGRSARRTRRSRIRYGAGVALASAAAAMAVGLLGPGGPAQQPEPAAPTPPTGSWQRTVTGAEEWSGAWSLTFAAGDVLELSTPAGLSPDEGADDGVSYAFDDNTLRLDAFSNGACLDQPVGSYRFTLEGDRLFLEAVDDPCHERREVFAGVWRPVS